jgi:hypothetical protein
LPLTSNKRWLDIWRAAGRVGAQPARNTALSKRRSSNETKLGPVSSADLFQILFLFHLSAVSALLATALHWSRRTSWRGSLSWGGSCLWSCGSGRCHIRKIRYGDA